jgi:hypothetical protein
MINNNKNLSFCNIGGEVYSEKISKSFLKSLIMVECEQMHMKNINSSVFFATLKFRTIKLSINEIH